MALGRDNPDQTRSRDFDGLPRDMLLVAQEVSLEVALQLATSFGGIELYLPKTIGPDNPIARLIGLDNARTLILILGDGPWLVPSCTRFRRRLRNREIRRERQAGASVRDVALKFGLHSGTIWRVIRRSAAPDA